MHYWRQLLVVFFIIIYSGALFCPAASSASALSVEEMVSAKKLYLIKCAKCHKLYEPQDYGEDDWQNWMGKMKEKAHLSDEQHRLISGYLDSIRRE